MPNPGELSVYWRIPSSLVVVSQPKGDGQISTKHVRVSIGLSGAMHSVSSTTALEGSLLAWQATVRVSSPSPQLTEHYKEETTSAQIKKGIQKLNTIATFRVKPKQEGFRGGMDKSTELKLSCFCSAEYGVESWLRHLCPYNCFSPSRG